MIKDHHTGTVNKYVRHGVDEVDILPLSSWSEFFDSSDLLCCLDLINHIPNNLTPTDISIDSSDRSSDSNNSSRVVVVIVVVLVEVRKMDPFTNCGSFMNYVRTTN